MNLPKIGENRFKIALVIASGYPLGIITWAVAIAFGKTADVVGILTALTAALFGVLATKEGDKDE